MTQATYTIAERNPHEFGAMFNPVAGIPRNLTKLKAESLASKARAKGLDVVAFNWCAE